MKREFLNTGKWAIVNHRAGEAQQYIKTLLELPAHVYPVCKAKCPPKAWGSNAPLRRKDYAERNALASMARERTGGSRGCLVAVPLDDSALVLLRLKDVDGLIVGFYP